MEDSSVIITNKVDEINSNIVNDNSLTISRCNDNIIENNEIDNKIIDLFDNLSISLQLPLLLPLPLNNNDNDITKQKNLKDEYLKSNIKKWIKLIPFNKTYDFSLYKRKDYFIHVADIKLDIELNKDNNKKRNTLIQFVPIIEKKLFEDKEEYIYIFLINDNIVKIGGTRTGLKGRVSSYLCGHHIEERGKSGDCSKTNGFIYNTFYFYLSHNANIKMYGYKIPKIKHKCDILDETIEITLQTYHAYESIFLNDFKNIYGTFPILCDNSDPAYK